MVFLQSSIWKLAIILNWEFILCQCWLTQVLAVSCYLWWCQECSCVFSPTRSVVRLAASLLTKLVDSLAPSITSVLVHGKQVSGHTDSRAWVEATPSLKVFHGHVYENKVSGNDFNVHWWEKWNEKYVIISSSCRHPMLSCMFVLPIRAYLHCVCTSAVAVVRLLRAWPAWPLESPLMHRVHVSRHTPQVDWCIVTWDFCLMPLPHPTYHWMSFSASFPVKCYSEISLLSRVSVISPHFYPSEQF